MNAGVPQFASARYAPIVLVLLIASGVAMASLRENPRHRETCRAPDQLLIPDDLALAGYEVSTGDGPVGVKRNPRLDGYLIPTNPRDQRLPFTIRRTLQITNWLVRPTIAVPGPPEPARFKEIVVDVDGTEVPIQIAYGMQRGNQRFAAYALAYDAEPIRSPFWLRIRQAPASLFTGIKPITYMGVAGFVTHVDAARHEQAAVEFITSAWRHYRKACAR